MKNKTDFDPERMLWVVVIIEIVLLVLFLVTLATISYYGHGGLLN